jgi:hypothetical protein
MSAILAHREIFAQLSNFDYINSGVYGEVA